MGFCPYEGSKSWVSVPTILGFCPYNLGFLSLVSWVFVPYVPAPLDVHTRGFWSSFRSWFKNLGKADAGGYRWGRDNGMNFWRGLRVSLTTSLVTAINGGMLELPGR